LNRFVVLDSWRGIAACAVAFYHLRAYSHVFELPLVRNAYLFVDFFFVLSGFVIAANYQRRLMEGGFPVGRFLLLRLGRLYPLHLVMLLAYIALKAVQALVPALSSIANQPPFAPPMESLDTMVANLLLIQGWNVYRFLTWNTQAWSVSTEFYAYVVFALVLTAMGVRAWIIALAAILAGPLTLYMLVGHMDTTFDYGWIRCLYGFAMGVLTWNIYRRWPSAWLRGTAAELIAVTTIALFVSEAGTTALSIAAPYVFALAVFVYAADAGAVSRVMRGKGFVLLGTISYSVYMVHALVAGRFVDLGKLTGFITSIHVDGYAMQVFGTNRWLGDLSYVAYLAIVIPLSLITYSWVERPAREWVRHLVLKSPRFAAAT